VERRTWPTDWDERRAGVGCPKCRCGRSDVDESGGARFYVGDFADGYVQRRAPQRGYTIVAFHRRHVADLTGFTDEESTGFWRDVVAVARTLEKVFTPCHLNYDVLGNTVPHVHVHIVPRYLDDPCPGVPLKPWTPRTVEPDEFAEQLRLLRPAIAAE
jgi:diadenosine tetraphosphate (Ap4A) HIT family hydrolase